MCSLRVCIPGEILEPKLERGMSHVQWIIASHTGGEGRGMQKATTAYEKTTTHHYVKREPARVQPAAQTLGWMKGSLTQTEWHITTLVLLLTRSHFTSLAIPFEALLCPGLLVSSNLHLGLPKLVMLEGEDAKWKGGHTKMYCNTSSFSSLTSTFPFTFSHSHTPTSLRLHLYISEWCSLCVTSMTSFSMF